MSRRPLPVAISEDRVIAIARGLPPHRVAELAEVLTGERIRAIEVTLDSPGALESIRAAASAGRDVGAGTVRSPQDATDAVEAGAVFLVSPHTDAPTVAEASHLAVPIIVGAMTPTEVVTAWQLGASAVKLFPASVGGPSFLSALRGPLSDVPIVPTGGVDAANASAYLAVGAVAVGVGGWLTSHDDVEVVRDRARALVTSIAGAN